MWWKRLLPTQAPYRLHLRSLRLGRTLDVGCGLGRNLVALSPGSVGVDHNPHSIALCRERGLSAWTTDEFPSSPDAREGSYDSLLMAHVLEHVDAATADEIWATYRRYLRPRGRVVLICPQERGYESDETHIRFVDENGLRSTAHGWGALPLRGYSFPLPRTFGRFFAYNEFVCLAEAPA